MQINMECPKCMNICSVPEETPSQEFACPHCRHVLSVANTRGSMPATNVLVGEAPSQPSRLGIDVEVLLGLSALMLIVVTAALFFARFHG